MNEVIEIVTLLGASNDPYGGLKTILKEYSKYSIYRLIEENK